jgi:hypothetical protein
MCSCIRWVSIVFAGSQCAYSFTRLHYNLMWGVLPKSTSVYVYKSVRIDATRIPNNSASPISLSSCKFAVQERQLLRQACEACNLNTGSPQIFFDNCSSQDQATGKSRKQISTCIFNDIHSATETQRRVKVSKDKSRKPLTVAKLLLLTSYPVSLFSK